MWISGLDGRTNKKKSSKDFVADKNLDLSRNDVRRLFKKKV